MISFLMFKFIDKSFNPLYTGGLFYCFMLDESIVILGVSGLVCHFYSIFDEKIYGQTI